MNPRILVVLSCASALLLGCAPSGPEGTKAELVAADKAFCAMSVREGPKAAYLYYITTDGKLQASDTRIGADAVGTTFMQLPPAARLSWEPSFVDVAASGDLGYTWGRYQLTLPNVVKGAAPVTRMGTYVTVWRRQPGGGWKFALNGFNPDGQR